MLPRSVLARFEPTAIRRLLAPLVENACAYAHSRVTISLDAGSATATISVRDDGPGLDPAEHAQVFSPGARGGAKRNPAAPAGTGLGLALAQRLARSMGGEIEIRHCDGGALFEVRLPLRG